MKCLPYHANVLPFLNTGHSPTLEPNFILVKTRFELESSPALKRRGCTARGVIFPRGGGTPILSWEYPYPVQGIPLFWGTPQIGPGTRDGGTLLCRQTYACENITFPILRMRAAMI